MPSPGNKQRHFIVVSPMLMGPGYQLLLEVVRRLLQRQCAGPSLCAVEQGQMWTPSRLWPSHVWSTMCGVDRVVDMCGRSGSADRGRKRGLALFSWRSQVRAQLRQAVLSCCGHSE